MLEFFSTVLPTPSPCHIGKHTKCCENAPKCAVSSQIFLERMKKSDGREKPFPAPSILDLPCQIILENNDK